METTGQELRVRGDQKADTGPRELDNTSSEAGREDREENNAH